MIRFTRVPFNLIPRLSPFIRCPPALDHQRCSTRHGQRRHTAFPLALAAASSTRTPLPPQPTMASIHGAQLPLPLHPQAKSHPSSPMPSVRNTVYYTLYVIQTLTGFLSLGSYVRLINSLGPVFYIITVIAEATVPAIYQQSFSAVDPTNSGETSVNSLSRVLSTSSLPAAKVDKVRYTHTISPTQPLSAHSCSRSPLSSSYYYYPSSYSIDFHRCVLRISKKIVNLVSTRPRVSKLEFFVALALVALAQTGKGT
jgi:hypothetical protein